MHRITYIFFSSVVVVDYKYIEQNKTKKKSFFVIRTESGECMSNDYGVESENQMLYS